MTKPIHIMLVEDHPEYREVIEMTLELESNLILDSQFGTAEMALRSLQSLDTRQEPDVILLDLNLPGMNGLDAIPYFNSAVPDAKIIVLTQSDREADVLRAIALGASGYLLKSSTTKEITEGIHTVANGGASLDSNVAGFILKTLKTKLPKNQQDDQQSLSQRELEVLTLLAEGLAKKEIADRLQISTSTVVTHVGHIYEKLNATNAPAAVHKAHLKGLFKPPE